MTIHAIRIPGGPWRIAYKVKAEVYGTAFGDPNTQVWCEQETTAFICFVGE